VIESKNSDIINKTNLVLNIIFLLFK